MNISGDLFIVSTVNLCMLLCSSETELSHNQGHLSNISKPVLTTAVKFWGFSIFFLIFVTVNILLSTSLKYKVPALNNCLVSLLIADHQLQQPFCRLLSPY